MVAYAILTSLYGFGVPDIPRPLAVRAIEYDTLWEVFYTFTIALSKTSIGIAILRIAAQRRHRIAALLLLIFCNIAYVAGIIYVFSACKPFAARWNSLLGTCVGDDFMSSMVCWGITFAVITDAGYVVLPIDMMRSLQMPPRLKYTLMAVMSLGGSAAIFAVARYRWASIFPTTYENTGKSSL